MTLENHILLTEQLEFSKNPLKQILSSMVHFRVTLTKKFMKQDYFENT